MKPKLLIAAIATLAITQCANAQWSLTGNTATDTAINFIGTKDAKGLKIKTNNLTRVYVDKGGRIGIGTANPQTLLDVYSPATSCAFGIRSDFGSSFLFMDKKNAADNAMVSYRTNAAVQWQTGTFSNNDFAINNFPLNAKALSINMSNNNVGIGTIAPTAKLHVAGTVKIVDGTQAAGKVLTSDVNGLASWQTPSGGGGSGWGLLGNAGTTATNFIGTTDSVALNFKVNNQKAGRISPDGIVFLGAKAGNINTTGSYNTGIGYIALSSNTIGYNNTACGAGALNLNTEGYNNTATGLNALYSNTTGYSNTVNGYAALSLNTTGYDNTANGVGALFNNTTGNGNTAVGTIAGNGNTIGVFNTFIGYNAQGAAALFNATAIGAGAYVATNNSLVLGNNVNVGIGNSSPTAKLHLGVSGYDAYQGLAITNSLSGGKTLTINQGALGKLNFTEPGVTDLFTMDFNTQRIGIGASNPGYKLDVCGVIRSNEVRVEIGWCDYVFNDDYKLPALSEVESFIKANKHLPDVTKGSIIEAEGLEVGKVSAQMIRKIEELTLYVIDLQKQVDELKKNNK